MKRLVLIIAMCLLAGGTHGTFEIADPAKKISDDFEKDSEGQLLPPGETDNATGEFVSGDTICRDFSSFRLEASREYLSSLDWLQGFINGAVYQRLNESGGSANSTDYDRESIGLWIDNYCRLNPPDTLTQAASAFVAVHVQTQ